MAAAAAGGYLGAISRGYDFAFFEYWLTDYAGHGQDMERAVRLLEEFDVVLGGLLDGWREGDLLLVTSDHGNMEDLSTRRHTGNPVPLLLVGSADDRRVFADVVDLQGVAPAILKVVERGQAAGSMI